MVDYSYLGNISGIIILASLFLKYISSKDKSQELRDEKFVTAIDTMARTHRDVAISNKEIAKYTKQGNEEAKERNGHLAELQLEGKSASNANAIAILEAVKEIKTQHVSVQNVDKQTIKEEIK